MKKALFFLLALPCLVFSQNSAELLARWEGSRPNWSNPTTIPVYYNTATPSFTKPNESMTLYDMGSSGNISFFSSDQSNGFISTNLPSTIDYGKYYQMKIEAGAGKKIHAKHLKMTTLGRTNTFKVVYQIATSEPTPASFSTNGTVLANVTNAPLHNEFTNAFEFGSGIYIQPGYTMYIRVYAFGVDPNHNVWYMRYNGTTNVPKSDSTGPAFYGVISDAAGVTAVADADTTYESTPVTRNVTANDTAIPSTTTIASVQIVEPYVSSNFGTASINGNSITFSPNGTLGERVIRYRITGSDGTTSENNYKVTVVAFPTPTVANDAATTGKNIPVTVAVLSNDTPGIGTFGDITITGHPSSGTAQVVGNKIKYTPTATFVGTVSISYTVKNSYGKTSQPATLQVTVVNITPVTAANDAVSTAKNTAITFSPLANDNAGNSAITSVLVTSNPANGSVELNADNTITYTPEANFVGTNSFTYSVTNAYNTTASATVTVTVKQPSGTGALCGTIVISATPQNVYPQFPTITAAVAHLNSNGVGCPVTFLLMDNEYTNGTGESFPIVISRTNLANTVTFKPGPGKNVTVRVDDIYVSSVWYQATTVFQVNGADNIIFDGSNMANGSTRNLTIFNNNTIDYVNRACVWVASNGTNGAQNVTIKHTNLRQGYRNQQGMYTLGVFAGSNTIEKPTEGNNRNLKVSDLAGGNNSNLYVWNNDFVNTKQGVYVQGGSTVTTGVNVFQNDLGAEDNQESVILPVSLNNVSNFSVSENLIYNLYRTTTAADLISGGINVKGNSTNGSITKNSMRNLERLTADANTFAGIVLAASSSTSNILVANNFILDPRAKGNGGGYSNGYGIIVDNGGGYKIFHNTVVLTKDQELQGYSAALYVNSNASKLDVRNNIFVNNQSASYTTRSAIMVNNDVDNLNNIFTRLDYNNYYSADKIGYIANIHSTGSITWPQNPDFVFTFGGWKAALAATNNSANANNKDLHSISFNPAFVSATDLHLATSNGAMNDKGQFIAEVSKDIDGQVRNTSTPDVGADEFGGIQMPEPGTNDGIYCNGSTTWFNGAWSNGEPAFGKDVIFRSNKTYAGTDIKACSIYVENGAQVNFISESNAYVTYNVNVAEGSSLTFESSSHLIQTENTQNTGNVVVKRNSSKLKRLDYVMWGSPVWGEQSLLDFSPATLTNRFYTYNTATDLYNAAADPSAVTFAKAKGYLIRMPNTHPASTPTVFQGVFEGTPNNGNVYFPLSNQGTGFNAVGNPYPSPISITAFIDANINYIQGTLWVWRKTNDHTQSSYCTMNKTGYTANAAPGGSSNDNDLIADPFQLAPGVGVLNTAQGFLVKAKSANKELVFRNNMRLDINYNNFFRNANDNSPAAQYDMSRMWLNVKSVGGDFTQALIAYSTQTTTGYDNGFDGETLSAGAIDLSSLIVDNGAPMRLAIQARAGFVNSDVVQLGFIAANAGTYTFEIDHVDGLFSGDQKIYLVDSLTGNFHDLKAGNYTFTAEAGTFDSRFTIVYATEDELGTGTPVLEAKDIMVYREGKQVNIKAPSEIKSVMVYDMLGRALYNNSNVSGTEFTTPAIDTAQQVVIIKVAFDNQQVVSKKIMMN
ncbi:Ig-like domain-containing protein [uncultured Flavobacterium sp.]|uniref:Ig-like domain-containing protein n=1 Tax=uncultured Flavobacterium sp. TaxID=165435 RepID=UPI0025DA3E59|nr:Ig-like domain-containing protein [uncultured Flavobacterium sp.]